MEKLWKNTRKELKDFFFSFSLKQQHYLYESKSDHTSPIEITFCSTSLTTKVSIDRIHEMILNIFSYGLILEIHLKIQHIS